METTGINRILCEQKLISSVFLQRHVKVDFYFPNNLSPSTPLHLLLINDGQDLRKMEFISLLEQQATTESSFPIIVVGIHCAPDRKMEYGVAEVPDFKGRGANAGLFTHFVTGELMPLIHSMFGNHFLKKAYAGFSLGGLMAFDIVWNHPEFFSIAGCFSASFWWRSVDQSDKRYDDNKHRIMQQQIRNGNYIPGLKFFFQTGNMDETKDRNNNGIIDSIDDTLDVIKELALKGYSTQTDIYYLELEDGRHDVATWERALPEFLKWMMAVN
jgi:enterochelin esterase-like enzyme